MWCHAPDPAGGANSAPQTSCLVFWERKERGKEKENKKGGKGKKGKGKKVKGKRRGGKEKETMGREGVGRRRERKEEKRRVKRKGGILCSCDFSLGKTLAAILSP